MKNFLIYTLFALLLSCGGGLKMSTQDMLALSGRNNLPTQQDYPNAGALILYENKKANLYLDSEWDVNVEKKFSQAILYFNDKAEDWTTVSIYLDPKRSLIEFNARTIKANGEIVELSEEDLHPTQLREDYVEFSDDQSVKFTFPAVEPGAILEYSYTINQSTFLGGDMWYIQEKLPKLYSTYSVELPSIFLKYYNWTYAAQNTSIGAPKARKNLLTEKSNKNRSYIYYWEKKDIPALKIESNMPSYYDVAQYVRLDLKYDNWNKLSGQYWEMIDDCFNVNDPQINNLAESITQNCETENEKIEAVFNYTQKNFRYIAMTIGESGYIPHMAQSILKNKYGDCKDMTVINSALLNALGIENYPALVNTKNAGTVRKDIVSFDFNHMINYVKASDGNEYWLDATGSSCPLGAVYSSIEGVPALVIYNDGKSDFKTIPASRYDDNKLVRNLQMKINDDGSVQGTAHLRFTGNENLSFRSGFKDATQSDMRKVVESYINSNTSNIIIDSLEYDDPSEIADKFDLKIKFHRDHVGSKAGDLLIFKPGIFKLEDKLSHFRDEERKYPIYYSAPFNITDMVTINFNPDKFNIESKGEIYRAHSDELSFLAIPTDINQGVISYRREYKLLKPEISSAHYNDFREVHKVIAKSNDENIVLKTK